jgi:alpha-beta hydrolase superfamily lysophospholipase
LAISKKISTHDGLALATATVLGTTEVAAQSAPKALPDVVGNAHWAIKKVDADSVKIYVWNKRLANPPKLFRGTIVFVHGSSMASTPVFDLQIKGRDDASLMDWFARQGYDTWCFDCEGYGRSDKTRNVNANVACGADDLAAVSDYIMKVNGGQKLLTYGASSGALRLALFAQKHPERIARMVLDAVLALDSSVPTGTYIDIARSIRRHRQLSRLGRFL